MEIKNNRMIIDNNEINLLTTKGEITWSWKEEDESPLIDIVTTNDNTRV